MMLGNSKTQKSNIIPLRIYGLLNVMENKIVKVGLDYVEISLDLELANNRNELELVEFDVNVDFID